MKPTMYVEKRSDLTLLKKAFELTDATCHRTRLKCGCKAYKGADNNRDGLLIVKYDAVDEMERSLHPSLIKQIILLFYKHSKDVSSQLIFTTHESSLMDQKIFRRDEIWLMKKDNNGISSFGRMDNLYNVRFDKMLQNSYLNGEYGATPIFETEEEINKLFSSLK